MSAAGSVIPVRQIFDCTSRYFIIGCRVQNSDWRSFIEQLVQAMGWYGETA